MVDAQPERPSHLFKKGQSGNPAGRPKGSRNKLADAFITDLLENWEKHGAVTIETVRDEKPDQYLKVVASILPKELNVKVNELDDLTDEQLARQLAGLAAKLANAGIDFGPGAGASEAPEPAILIQTLP